MTQSPILGIIGGSGLYHFSALTDVETLNLTTPFGSPSSPFLVGTLSGKRVAFLARHGIGHFIPPTEVNYRANIYAFKMLDVPQIVSISACGSLRDDYEPGHIVIPDQLVDRTVQRARSFFEQGLVAHISVADPFCTKLSEHLYSAVNKAGGIAHKGGTLITIEGPRFSTRAESNLYRAWGMSLIGMTACPEAFLAREAEICYATMAHVTDYDVWHISQEPVTVEMVIRTLTQNTETAQAAILNLVEALETGAECGCHHALADAILTHPGAISPSSRQKLNPLVKKYLAS